MVIFLLPYLPTFSGQLYYWRSYFFTLLNYFDKTVALLEHLFIRPVAFFKELRFRKSYFLATVIFSEYLIFRNQTSTKQSLCENRKFFRVVTFWNSYFFGGLIAQNKDIYRRIPLIEAGTSAQHQLFQKSYIFEKPTFPGELPFHKGYFLKAYFFRRVAISQLCFLSTATLTIYQLAIK